MQPQTNLGLRPQPEQQSGLQMDPQTMPQSESIHKPQLFSLLFSKIIPIASFALAAISLIISVASISISSQPHQSSSVLSDSTDIDAESTNGTVAGTFESKTTRIGCNLPKSASDIVYLYLNYDYGKVGIFISPDEAIEIFTKETNETGNTVTTSKNLKTNTDDIFKQLLSDGIENFSDYEFTDDTETSVPEKDVEWSWLAQIDNSDSSSCEAKGNDTPPAWFTKLTSFIQNKFNL